MQTSDFDFKLPDELIAQRPPKNRGDSRMMVVDQAAGTITHRQFSEFPSLVREDDLLVLNDTKVVAARYFSNDGSREILRVDVVGPNRWKCLVRPGKRFKPGRTIEIGDCTGTVVEVCEAGGERIIEFDQAPDEAKHGHLALPPYIERPDEDADKDRYQTVYAREAGAIAAPTAGLHFSAEMLSQLPHEFVTLHVGVGTFRPVSVTDLSEHHMHSERYELRPEAADRIEAAGRTFAIGTTVVRVLESCAKQSKEAGSDRLLPGRGDTDIFIYPPYQFGVVDALLTNFHLPKSTLLMLVSAFTGRELALEAYHKAVEERYRFFSYGDCMVLI
ncbi:tRNA preQ1(34) S-adenosylmethionine ribosyltransferase-isomerase QueA [Verrucomicrobiales bacterium]|nr:tRNA preQ1(34) S-adenosylmethionine ribosyltransferase-isomerase QueA [Verrucomicrobiales bacterium]MDB4358936.1 tRNA preQ1(34) S-adenosylmethionine ribosyltransferase-isomerase QueA [Verrucomicrobiales bacterium]